MEHVMNALSTLRSGLTLGDDHATARAIGDLAALAQLAPPEALAALAQLAPPEALAEGFDTLMPWATSVGLVDADEAALLITYASSF